MQSYSRYIAPLLILFVSNTVWAQEQEVDCRECASTSCNAACVWPFGPLDEPDPDFGKQWYIESVRACEVWSDPSLGYTGNGVIVGIVDLGRR